MRQMLCSHELDSIISSDDEDVDESGRIQEVLRTKRARPTIAVPSLCQQRAVEAAEELQQLDAEAFELARSLCWEQELRSSLQCQQDLLQQRVTILASSVSRLALGSRACGVSRRCEVYHASNLADSGGSPNWFTKISQMADGSEVADILQDIEEFTRQNAADEVEIAAVRADLISRTDLRIHGEMTMRDELLAHIDALQQQVEAAKEEGEDNAAELCGLRMQLVNLRRCSIASTREAEVQHLLAKQQELNTSLSRLISSTANQHGLVPAGMAAGARHAGQPKVSSKYDEDEMSGMTAVK